uniref:Uncharacterized protein n=1 Tax=Sciurus vulgaris TaxID=55149 RepID=A0A8D2BFH3_SCIVU
ALVKIRSRSGGAHLGCLWMQLPGSLSSPGFSADLLMLDSEIRQRESPSSSSYP